MDSNNPTNKVVVVEGYHDLARIQAIFPTMDLAITNGLEISDNTLDELKQLNESRGLILFLDPDVPGETIRRIINQHVGETAHAFLPKNKCISKNKKKVGIEHANTKDIIAALQQFRCSQTNPQSDLTMQHLFNWKLAGHPHAKHRRQHLCETLGIGLANGKTLLRKLRMFGFNEADIIPHVTR